MGQVTPSAVAANVQDSIPTRTPAAGVCYGPVAAEMREVESRLAEAMQSRFDELRPILEHGVMLGGKRLRPALTLLSGAASGSLTPDHVVLATVMEMIHTATLVHDDVLDSAERRRHVATVNQRWNSGCSILLGDFLFAQSFYLASTLGDAAICQAIGRAARRVCEGELKQIVAAGDLELSESSYFEQIEGKTAELTQVSCELGAKLAGAGADRIEALSRYGRCLGIAFQIADDGLDIWGNDESVGKTLGSDLAQAKATLPVIRALQVGSPQLKRDLMNATEDRNLSLNGLRELLDKTDAQEYTSRVAGNYVREAEIALDSLGRSDAREVLRTMVRFAANRIC